MSPPRLKYQTIEFGDMDIHVRGLRDLMEFSDDEGEAEAIGISDARWSLFGVLWDAGHVLAHLMARYDIGDRSVLEIGCGLGLSSLVLNKRGCNVTAVDWHPEAEAFLDANTQLNGDPKIPFVRGSWSDPEVHVGTFDVIIGSDILYESDHAAAVAQFVLRHVNEGAAEFIMADGGRGECRSLKARMAEAGFVHDQIEILDGDFPKEKFKGKTHRFRRPAS